MNQIYAELLSYLRMVWRRRWIVLTVAWIVCIGGWVVVATIPDSYQSSARVYIDTESVLKNLMKGLAVGDNVFQRISIIQRTLFSRPNLEKVILMTDLDIQADTPEEMEKLIKEVAAKVSLGQQGANLFRVGYTDQDPELARKVVQSVLSIMVESILALTRTDMDETQQFLDNQVESYDEQLRDAERRIAQFKHQNIGLLPGRGDFYSNLDDARGQVGSIRSQLSEAITVRDLLRSQLAAIPEFHEMPSAPAVGGFGPNAGYGPPTNTIARVLELEYRIDSLLLNYTEKHPDVVAARRLLDKLLAQKEQEDAAAATRLAELAANFVEEDVPTNLIPNPVYQQLQIQLVNQESTIASLQNRLVGAEQNLVRWNQRVDTAPLIETQLKDLTRDYELVRRRYAALRERQESARLAEELDTKTNKVQFRIVDPPQVPIAPVGPNRPLLLAGVFGASIGAGVAFALLLGLIRSSFPDTMRLRGVFPMPVFGSVTLVLSVADRRRQAFAFASFTVVLVGLVGTFASLIMVETLGGAFAAKAMQIAETLHVTFVFDMLKTVVQRLNVV
ncbi:MAG: XrtA system polysaccharide chain length determinant [Alphaproteobacteria bacterium]